MSNAKRISRKKSEKDFIKLRKEFAWRLWMLEAENTILKNTIALFRSRSPRKPFPLGDFNPPKNKNSVFIGEVRKEMILGAEDKFHENQNPVRPKACTSQFNLPEDIVKDVEEFISNKLFSDKR